MKLTITKEFGFDSAHRLPWHEGKCADIHGHSYRLAVTVSKKMRELAKKGVIIDFDDLKELVNKHVIERYDHKLLNAYFDNPTAELTAIRIFKDLRKVMPKDIELVQVDLWETAASRATVKA